MPRKTKGKNQQLYLTALKKAIEGFLNEAMRLDLCAPGLARKFEGVKRAVADLRGDGVVQFTMNDENFVLIVEHHNDAICILTFMMPESAEVRIVFPNTTLGETFRIVFGLIVDHEVLVD